MRNQIALDYMIVFIFTLFIFILIFASIANQRAIIGRQQVFSQLQYVAEDVASQLTAAYNAGNGFNSTIPLPAPLSTLGYNISITRQGAVIVTSNIIGQDIEATSFSLAQPVISNPSYLSSTNLYYNIPTVQSNGYITFENSFGTICVDYACPSTSNQSKSMVAYDKLAEAQQFNGYNVNDVQINGYSWMADSASQEFSISIWMNPSSPNGDVLDEQDSASPCMVSGCWHDTWIELDGVSGSTSAPLEIRVWPMPTCLSLGTIPLYTWSHVVMVYNGADLYGYVNGALDGEIPVTRSVPGAGYTYYDLGVGDTTNCGSALPYNGLLSNYQFYNTSLSAPQVLSLYQEGIAGQPVSSAIVGWQGSEGGFGNNMQFFGPTSFQTIAQVYGYAQNVTGAPLQGVPIGFITSSGSFSGHQAVQALTNNGLAWAFLNGSQSGGGTENVKVIAFNGNSSTASDLLAWWPLSEDIGSVAHDLGPSSATSSPFNARLINTFWAAPKYVAQFNGQNSYIQITNSLKLDSLTTLTVTGWANVNGSSAGFYGWFIAQEDSWGLAYCGAGDGGLCYYNWGCSTYPNCFESAGFADMLQHTWYFFTDVIQGLPNGQATIYINGLYAGKENVNEVPNTNRVQIGYGNCCSEFFNGTLSDMQVYDTALSVPSIQTLYGEGIGGAPLGTGNLVAWWPLDGDSDDYSGFGNNGAVYGAVQMVAPNVNLNSSGTNLLVSNFSGSQSVYLGSNEVLLPSANITVTAWIKTPSTDVGGAIVYGGDNAISTPTYFSGYLLRLDSNDAEFQVAAGNGLIPGYYCQKQGGLVANNNEWHFIAGTYNDIVVSLFQDGSGEGTVQCSPPGPIYYGPSGNAVNLGYYLINLAGGGTISNYYSGLLSNVQIYDTALSESQLTQLYDEGISGFPLPNVGLVGWWPLNGDINDHSSGGNDGSGADIGYNALFTTSLYSIPSFGGSGLALNGAGYAEAPSIIKSPTSELSVSAWIYPGSLLYAGTTNDIISGGTFGAGWELGYTYPANAYMSLNGQSIEGTIRIPPKSWSNIIASWSGSNVIFYVNGVANGPFTESTTLAASASPTCIGSSFCTGTNDFNGTISDVQVYDTALSAQQAFQLYDSGPPPSGALSISSGVTP